MNRNKLPELPKMPAVPKAPPVPLDSPSLDLPPEPEVGIGAAVPPDVSPGRMPPPPAPILPARAPAVMPDVVKPKPKSVAESIAPTIPRQKKAYDPTHIEVQALRAGHYDKDRRNEGDTFYVEKFEELGSWMQPTDPVIAARYRLALEEKKRARFAPRRQRHLLDDAD